MRIGKKLMAMLLSVMLMLSVVIIPTAVSAEETQITKTVKLFDLSSCRVGAFTAYPSGITDSKDGLAVKAGTIVNLDGGSRGLKIDLAAACCTGDGKYSLDKDGSRTGYTPQLGITLSVPEYYRPYLTNISLKYSKDTSAILCHNFGVSNGTVYTKPNNTNQTVAADLTGEQTVSYTVADLYQVSAYGSTHYNEAKKGTQWGDLAVSTVYFWMGASEATGSVTVEDISLTLSLTESQWNEIQTTLSALPKTTVKSLLDLSSYELGTLTAYGEGVSEFAPVSGDAYNGTKEIALNANGQKSLKLDLTSAAFACEKPSDYQKIYQGGYSPVYCLKLDVPSYYSPFITDISCVINKQSSARVVYELGVTDGTTYSRRQDQNQWLNSDYIGAKGVSWPLGSLSRVSATSVGYYGSTSSTEKWGTQTFDSVFLILTANAADGYVTIDDISYTMTATDDEIQEVLDSLPKTITKNLLDLSDNDLGALTVYPMGVRETTPLSGGSYAGTKEVVATEDGGKALKLDMTSAAFTCGDPANYQKLFQGGYSPIYCLKLNVPSAYSKYIENISLSMDKESSARVVYEFGVTDGTKFSKRNENNSRMDSAVTGQRNVTYTMGELKRVTEREAGQWTSTSGVETWKDYEFNSIFLWVSADAADGYLLINSISYTLTANDAQMAEADAEINATKGLIADYESSGTETAFASGGSKAFAYLKSENYKAAYSVFDLSSNDYTRTASGVSFWMYNDADTEATVMAKLNSATTLYGKTVKIPAKSYQKVYLDFNDINVAYPWTNSGKRWVDSYTATHQVVSTAERATFTTLMLQEMSRKNKPIYLDDVWLVFEDQVETAKTLGYTAETVSGGVTLNQDGSVFFPASAEGSDITARITVPTGYFKAAQSMDLTYSSDTAAKYSVTVLGTNDSGVASHWKWGYKEWTSTVAAGAVDTSLYYSFAGSGKAFERNTVHEGPGEGGADCNKCVPTTADGSSGHANNGLTPSERATVTTVLIRVFENVGETTQGFTLKPIDVSYGPNTLTAVQPEDTASGSITVARTGLYSGNTADVMINPAAGYYVSSYSVLDNLGNTVPVKTVKNQGGANLSNYYSFTMPEGNVTVSANFVLVDKTIMTNTEFADNKSTFKMNFEIPFIGGKVYNENVEVDDFRTIDNYGVLVAPEAALAKYGYTEEDLTPELYTTLKTSGHYLANFIYVLDFSDASAMYVDKTDASVKFAVEFTDVPLNAHRNNLIMKCFATFTEADATDVNSITNTSLDALYYGPNFTPDFYAGMGISYSSTMQKIDTLTETDQIFQQSTWDDIIAHGFDHVRIPVELGNSVDANGVINEQHLAKLDKVLDLGLKAGLSLVVDLHGYKTIVSNYDATKAEFIGVWQQLAERYAYLPYSVAFELLNEPATDKAVSETVPDPMTTAELFELEETVLGNIRSTANNEDRTVILTNNYNKTNASLIAEIPDSLLNHDNIIFDFHCYNPMSFTHSGATWQTDAEGNMKYPAGATSYNASDFISSINNVAALKTAHPNVGVWMGEFGVYQADETMKLQYFTEFTNSCAENDVPWCIWEYGSTWGPYRKSSNTWVDSYLEALGLQ